MSIVIRMPQLSDTMKFGTIVKWRKKEGDAVKAGDVLAEVETDKATMEIEAFDAGILRKTFLKEGERVPIGRAIAVIAPQDEDIAKEVSALEAEAPGTGSARSAVPVPLPIPLPNSSPKLAPVAEVPPKKGTGTSRPEERGRSEPVPGGIRATPAARKMAEAERVPLARVRGTGPGGRITLSDVEVALRRGARYVIGGGGGAPSAPPPARPKKNILESRRIPFDGMRKTIARRMTESKNTAPHFYLHDEIRADGLVAARERRNAESPDRRYSFNDLVMFVVARTLMAHPEINVTIEDEAVVRHDAVDLAFAVALPNGLLTPIVHGAHALDLPQLHDAVRDLAGRAKEGGLAPEEYQGGTFTVSNLGAAGIACFNAVINQPQGAILAVAAARRAVFADEDGAIRPGWSMWVTLSCDHRGIDGAVGAMFLKDLREALEAPSL